MYHNTTESTGAELKQYREKAKSQEDMILEWFKWVESDAPCSMARATPTTILRLVFNKTPFSPDAISRNRWNAKPPITSVRRALTNLTDAGDLVKTDKQVKGPYGRPEFIWKLAPKYNQQEMF